MSLGGGPGSGRLPAALCFVLGLALLSSACEGSTVSGDAAVRDATPGDGPGADTSNRDAGGCSPTEFRCDDAECIEAARECDGMEDCTDGSDEICGGIRAEQWRVAEITLSAESSYDNPFMDVEVLATFTHTDGTEITRLAYWHDGDTWKVRFAPTKTGRWTYRTVCSNRDDAGLHDQTGRVIGEPYAGPHAIYRHGFLQVSESGRFLAHRDGTPFFYLADTHWFLEREDFDAQFRPMMARRVEQGFTAVQSHPGEATLSNAGATRIDPASYASLDSYFALIADQGLVHAFGLAAHVSIAYFTPEGAARLARYVNARYGAYPVLFFTSQEVDIEGLEDNWKPTFDAWNGVDDYDHPATCHVIGSTRGEPTLWGAEEGHDLFFLQAGHGRLQRPRHYEAYYQYAPTKPFIEAEANYEEIRIGAPNHADRVRMAAYRAMQTGAAGFGYGASGIWNLCTSDSDCACCEAAGIHPWYEAVHFPGGRQMRHLVELYTTLRWWRLVPRFEDPSWSSFTDPDHMLVSSDGSDLYVVYSDARSSGSLRGLHPESTYTARWFDPRSGAWSLVAEGISPVGGQWTVPRQPDSQDWLLVVSRDGVSHGFRFVQSWAGPGGDLFPAGIRAVPSGEGLELAAVPRAGYHLSSLAMDGVSVSPSMAPAVPADDLDHTFYATFTGAHPAGLVGEWRLDGPIEDQALDTASDAHGTLRGAAFIAEGRVGNSIDLDGHSGVVEIGDLPQLEGMVQLTVSAWLRLDSTPPSGFAVVPIGKEVAYRFVVGAGGGMHFAVGTTSHAWYGPGTRVDMGSARLTLGTWHHVAATYDGTRLRSYFDGTFREESSPAISGAIVMNSAPLRFSDTAAVDMVYMDGRIDEVRIYDRALSPGEIRALYETP